MSRSERLLNLLQVLRQYKCPVSAKTLADKTGVSLRTIYRDIATLQSQGAVIEGEPGLGYLMKPGFTLPPLMFTLEELDALVLGMRWVIDCDITLRQPAESLLAKIAEVLPIDLRCELNEAALLIGAKAPCLDRTNSPDILRSAIREQRKVSIFYSDSLGETTQRTIWPFALVYFEQSRILMSWCELRNDFRSFRTDRITKINLLSEKYPKYRQQLLAEWRKTKYVPNRSILP